MSTKLAPLNPGIVRMAEKRLAALEMASRQHPVSHEPKRQEVQPFICVSRMVGSGGTQVATLLGERLGWPVYDKEILQAMGGDDQIRTRLYASLDERDTGWLEGMLRSLMDAGFSRNDYFHRLTKAILCLARKSPAVFVGRGSDLILPRNRGLRVRFVAPAAQCLRAFAERYRISEEKARQEIQRVETERQSFVRSHFHSEPGDPTRYDLVVNLGFFSVSDAAELVLNALRSQHVWPPQ